MIEIKNTIVSRDVVEKKFLCDINICKGQCCIEGDSGAPLEKEEVATIEKIYTKIMPFMRNEGIQAIKQQGLYVVDYEDDLVTPLINGQECAYVIFENNIAKCAFEKAYEEGLTNFKKPISCHLYPIRIAKLKKYDAINYDQWHICECARIKGEEKNLEVYKFLKEPLIRKYGKDWYKELQLVASELAK